MKRFKHYGLQYFELGSNKPVVYHFENYEDLVLWFKTLEFRQRPINGYEKRVFLLTHDEIVEGTEDFDLFVTENLCHVIEILQQEFLGYDACKVWHFQEYKSYEDAYEVALLLREGNILCYNNTGKL